MPTATRPVRVSPQLPAAVLPLLVLTATLVVYLGTLQFEFVYDDLGQIVGNPMVQSWSYLPALFHSNVWAQSFQVGNYYRPLFMVWLLLNYTFFGLRPFFWHLAAVGLHLTATWLVFVLAARLARDRRVAAAAALVFGLHPAHLEAVAWVSGSTEPLLAVLLIPAFLSYLNYRERGRRAGWLALSAMLFAAAIFAKETAVVLPALVLAWEWVGAEEPAGWKARLVSGLRVVIPFVLLTGVYLAARASALHGLAHTLVDLPLRMALLTIPSVLWFYLRLLLVPFPLSAFYDVPYVTHVSWHYFWRPLLESGAVLAVLAAWWWRTGSRLIGFAAIWLLLPLLPLLDLRVLPMGDFVHDRYLYLPSVGLAILLALALEKLPAGQTTLLGEPAPALAALLLLGCGLGAATALQSVPWANDVLLYSHGVEIAPNNDLPRNKLANALITRGLYEEGISVYRGVLAQDPDFWFANYRMGFALYKLGRFPEAEKYLAHAVEGKRTGEECYYLGLAQKSQGKLEQAAASLSQAAQLAPQARGYHGELAKVLLEQGKKAEALEAFKAELALDPGNAEARQQVADVH